MARNALTLIALAVMTSPALARGGGGSGFLFNPYLLWELAKVAGFCHMFVALFYVFCWLMRSLALMLCYAIAFVIEQRATVKRYAVRAWRGPAA